ncbi:MAG: sulfotransferase, partial [Gallionellaceae bacterium]|nr:sulfotransferase [Gallionellaceae bacterium]
LIDQALARAPAEPTLLSIKCMVTLKLGQLDEAGRYIKQAIAISPHDFRLHNFHGQVLAAYGNLPKNALAERAFGQAISLNPAFFEAWYNLGHIQLLSSKPHEAIQSFEQAARIDPRNGGLQFQLAKTYYLMREFAPAVEAMKRAATCGMDPTLVNLWRSLVLRAEGKTDEADAIEQVELEKSVDPSDMLKLLTDFGHAETHVGHLDRAVHWLRKAIAMDPTDAHLYCDLAAAHKFTADDRDLIGRMEGLLTSVGHTVRRPLEFALGKAYTDLAEYDLSFCHYKAGNDLVRSLIPYDAEAQEVRIGRIIERYSAERLADLAAGSDSDLPILIVGTMRSGTTLTEQIISSHSAVAGAGEMDFWVRIGPSLTDTYDADMAAKLASAYLDLMRQHSKSARRITDKMPLNFLHLGAIHAVFPNAKIVHCRRHPIDACLSIYFQNFDDSQAFKWDLDSLVAFYEQYQRVMAHWRAVLPPGTLYELQYEALVEDFEGESRKLMDFLGLDWEPGQLEFYKHDSTVFTPSNWQVRQPIYKTSKERWRRYEKHLGPLLDLLKYAPD